jgi:serine/threonine protein kinase
MNVGYTTAQLNFETLEEIGQEGKNSRVFRSHDKQLDAEIVTKQIEKTKLVNANEYFAEAKRLYDSSHPNVVQIKYACQDQDYIYLAMPFYKNGSLKKLVDQKFLTVREILRYSIQFLTGLNNIHVKKLIHFDIKPDNILLSDSNESMVSDFGLTKNMNRFGMTAADQVYSYQAPPDVFLQSQQSNLYDIYMAGVTIYRLCNGNENFYEQVKKFPTSDLLENAILRGDFPDRKSFLPHIPKKLRSVINKAMSLEQTKRHQTVIELINELSVIDDLLDWQYSESGNELDWILDLDDKIFEVRAKNNLLLTEIQTSKKMKQSGKTQKVNAGCKNNVAVTDLDRTIQTILLGLNQ